MLTHRSPHYPNLLSLGEHWTGGEYEWKKEQDKWPDKEQSQEARTSHIILSGLGNAPRSVLVWWNSLACLGCRLKAITWSAFFMTSNPGANSSQALMDYGQKTFGIHDIPTHTCTQTHALACTHTDTHMYARTHACTHPHRHTHTHKHKHIHVCKQARTHTHTHTHTKRC